MIGRVKECASLRAAFDRKDAQFVAVYGRRRIGKTYLIREYFNNDFCFYHTGVANVDTEEQLMNFRDSLVRYGYEGCPMIRCWREAFLALEIVIDNGKPGRKVVFIDELPWMDTKKSKFVSALEHFWNGWASARKDILLIVCGSATSWMINKLIKDHGGLHNRVTDRIHLEPFCLGECELFCKDIGLNFTREEICMGYMIFGGVPFYWNLMTPGKSLRQNVDELVFAKSAKLKGEFDELFSSLFKNAPLHLEMIKAMSGAGTGLSRDALLKRMKIKDGGTFTKCLDDLEYSGFVRRYNSFGKKKKESLFQVVDNFVNFHMKYLEGKPIRDENLWVKISSSQQQAAWRGNAFERVCFHHVWQIKNALGVSGVETSLCSWRHVADEVHTQGAQIDMLIDRADGVIDICEMKYVNDDYEPSEKSDKEIRRRMSVFADVAETRKAICAVLVTPYGLSKNLYSGRYSNVITFNELFKLEQ